jgi:hypothetical protein
MSQRIPPLEFRELLDRLIENNGLSRTEMGRFEDMLLDQSLRSYCCEILLHEALLPDALATMEMALEKLPAAGQPLNAPQPSLSRRIFQLAAAIVLAFGAGWMIGERSTPGPSAEVVADKPVIPPIPTARITGMIGVKWGETASGPRIAAGSMAAERVVFDTGLIELTYASGVKVTLQGPADFDVTGDESGRISSGKLVVRVPQGAEGFSIDYANGRVVDLGTEFAMEVGREGELELGVFDGEVELHLPGDDAPFYLAGSQAIIHDLAAEEPLVSIPFEREKFVRQLPSRDFPWKVESSAPLEFSVDVSHLIWKPSAYRAIFKWISGGDVVVVRDVELRCDDTTVAVAPGPGQTGNHDFVHNNLFELNVPSEALRYGKWTLHAKLAPLPRPPHAARPNVPVSSSGIMLFEEGGLNQAVAADFVGRWAYHYAGARYAREFHADGSITLSRNGRHNPRAFAGCRWWVEEGVLYAESPKHPGRPETHVLRDRDTLIFTSLAFENARRVSPKDE